MTPVEQRNVEILSEAYRRWHEHKADSAEHWMDLMADDIRWRSLGTGAAGDEFAKECVGKQSFAAYFQGLAQQWELLNYNADEYIAQGDRVVMLGSAEWKHRKTGKVVHTPKADVFRMRDGKVSHFMEYYDTAAVLAGAQA